MVRVLLPKGYSSNLLLQNHHPLLRITRPLPFTRRKPLSHRRKDRLASHIPKSFLDSVKRHFN